MGTVGGACAVPLAVPKRERAPRIVSCTTMRGVSREAVIADNGVVLTGELDVDDSMLYVAAASDAARASGPAPAEVFSDWGPGCARLFGGVSCAEVEVVGS